MIETIKLKISSGSEAQGLSFEPGDVTVIVGPNNSGKSLLLREIDAFCTQGENAQRLILDEIKFNYNEQDILNMLNEIQTEFLPHEHRPPDHIKYETINSGRGKISFASLPSQIVAYSKHPNQVNYCAQFIRIFSVLFSGKNRFELIANSRCTDLKSVSTSNLMSLFQCNDKRKKVRQILYEAFNKYFVIDPTNVGNLEIRYADELPLSENIEKGWTSESVNFHKKAKHILEFSDGVQAFTGLVLATFVGNEKAIFIDEPEAFLHPNLANLLGKTLSELISARNGHLIVSTHSAAFLMGCLQSGKKVNILRLTYDMKGEATARILPSSQVSQLFKDPLLRSTGAIQALFYNNVIVTEADTDRAFYDEINHRMLFQEDGRGIKDCLFLNAQNKQTIHRIIKPLREFGIKAVSIMDLDMIKDGKSVFTNILQAHQISELSHQNFQNSRNRAHGFFKDKNLDPKLVGISALPQDEQDFLEKFINDLNEYGIFVVKRGELEKWLLNLSDSNDKIARLIEIFNKMRDDPADPEYVYPDNDDVWQFIDEINDWFKNPSRKGIN